MATLKRKGLGEVVGLYEIKDGARTYIMDQLENHKISETEIKDFDDPDGHYDSTQVFTRHTYLLKNTIINIDPTEIKIVSTDSQSPESVVNLIKDLIKEHEKRSEGLEEELT